MQFRRSRQGLAAIAVVAWLLSPPMAGRAAAQEQPVPADAFRRLNDTAIAIYRDAKNRFLAASGPVVIARLGSVVIRQNDRQTRVGQMPPGYHLLKAIGHAPRSLWAALRPAIEGLDPHQSWRGKLTELRPEIATMLAALPESGLPPAAVARDGEVLRTCIAAIDRTLAEGLPSEAALRREMQALAPALLADADEAAQLQLDALDRDLRPWWNALDAAERERTFVIVLGGKTMRPGNVVYNYFVSLLGDAEDGHRVVYAEGVFDEKGADAVLATLLTDRRLATDFFADERRMERDLLGDAAAAHLAEMLGTPDRR